MTERVDTGCRGRDGGCVPDVAVDEGSRQSAARRLPREHDRIVTAADERRHDGGSEIARPAGNEDLHGNMMAYP